LDELKNNDCDIVIKNYTVGKYLAVLANNNLLANKIDLLAKPAIGE